MGSGQSIKGVHYSDQTFVWLCLPTASKVATQNMNVISPFITFKLKKFFGKNWSVYSFIYF